MKKMVCEICGSPNLMKKDGMFVCENCDTKYSVEEAKKLLGTVKIDNTDQLKNFFKLANNAYEAENLLESENYCNKIIEIDMDNYEAWFLKGKSAGWQSTVKKLRIKESVDCFEKALKNCPKENIEKMQEDIANEISSLIMSLIIMNCNNFTNYVSASNVKDIIDSIVEMHNLFLRLIDKCKISPKKINKEIADLISSTAISAWNNTIFPEYANANGGHPYEHNLLSMWDGADNVEKLLKLSITLSEEDKKNNPDNIQKYKSLINIKEVVVGSSSQKKEYNQYGSNWVVDKLLNDETREKYITMIKEWHGKIKEIDPEYEIPVVNIKKPSNGCYVATAVYGSYNCPQVWLLRRYRDFELDKTWYGKLFIKVYYFISPTLVKYFGKTKWFKKIVEPRLEKLIGKLKEKGYSDKPYNDKEY